MANQLIVNKEVVIYANPKNVWEVLTNSIYILQWDDLPDSFLGDKLELGSVLDWDGYSRLTVTEYIEMQSLRLNMYLPKLNINPSEYDINYLYRLKEEGETTILTITIGDFYNLPNADLLFSSTNEFADSSIKKIKELAEAI